MKLTRTFILILIVGLISACGSQPAETPASQPTEEIVPPTQAPTNPPASTDTNVPPTEVPTELPTDTPTTEPAAATGVSFASDIMPILQSRCVNCHGGERLEEGLSLKSYSDLMAGSDNGPVVTVGDANNSLLAEMVVTQEMPKRGPKLTPPQAQLIVDWINQGALDN